MPPILTSPSRATICVPVPKGASCCCPKLSLHHLLFHQHPSPSTQILQNTKNCPSPSLASSTRVCTHIHAHTHACTSSLPPQPSRGHVRPYFVCMAWEGLGSPASNLLIGKCSRKRDGDERGEGRARAGGAGRDEMGVLKLRALIPSMWPYIILIKPAHPALTTAAVPFLSSCESHLFLISKITCLSNRDRSARH